MPDRVVQDPILELAHPDVLPNPYPAYARLRDTAPVFWHEGLASWMLTRHADCAAVLRDSQRFAADWRKVGEDVPSQVLSVQSLDPPEHTAVRRLLVAAMRSAPARDVRHMITAQTRQLLHQLSRRQSFDFITEFAEPIALQVICAWLGVPAPPLAEFIPAANTIAAGMDGGLWPDRVEAAMSARAELADLTATWLACPPESGIVRFLADRTTGARSRTSDPAHGSAGADEVDPAVLANSLRVLLHAGYASASKLIGLAGAVLLTQEDALRQHRAADPTLAAEELVRVCSPVQAIARACVEDTELAGVQVRAGDAVTLLLGAANRDPARFPEPDTPLWNRHPNPHLGFGRGAHSCLGSSLATQQLQIIVAMLADTCPAARAVAEPTYQSNLTLRGLEHLEVALR